LRHQPRVRSDPRGDVERAYDRLEYLLSREARPREPGETPRAYLRAVGDDRARRVGELYERAVYAGRATEAVADEAVSIVDDLVADRSWP
jgi:hypothetical protein